MFGVFYNCQRKFFLTSKSFDQYQRHSANSLISISFLQTLKKTGIFSNSCGQLGQYK